jgi:hypothetical protein
MPRAQLEALEGSDLDLGVALVWLVADTVSVPDAELKAALRRAMLVLASGGDPHRELGLHDVAVGRLAEELDTPARRTQLQSTLAGLDAEGLPSVAAALAELRGDGDLAWRTYALARLADELADG